MSGWKPFVWSEAEHYPQWLSYPTRPAGAPEQGAEVTLSEHPGQTYLAVTVEEGTDPLIVWLDRMEP
jgi:hypothetical protein